jgi:hypothetical protein
MKNLRDVPDSYRITGRDFRAFDKYLDETFFAKSSPERMKRLAAGREFFRLMVVALDLKSKGQKVITVGHVRAIHKSRADAAEKHERERAESIRSLKNDEGEVCQ